MFLWKILKTYKGFTLIELLISVTILGILIISFLSFFNQAYDYTKRNEDKTVGINVARNVLYYMEQQDTSILFQKYLSPNKNSVNLTKANCNDTIVINSTQKNIFDPTVCKGFFSTQINNVNFETTILLTRHETLDPEKYAIPIEVNVYWGNHTASVRGLINNE